MQRIVLLGGLLLLTGGAGWAKPIEEQSQQGAFQVSLRVERDRCQLAESLKLHYQIKGPQDSEINFPKPEQLDLKPFEVRDADSLRLTASGGQRTWEYRVKVTPYQLGKLQLPPAQLKTSAGVEINLPGANIEVERIPTTPSDKPGEIRPVKPLQALGMPLWLKLTGTLGVLLSLLALAGLVRWLRRPPQVQVAPPLPPYLRAFKELDRIQAEGLDVRGQWEAFYDQVTQVLRSYLGWRFQVPLLEKTTSEILTSLSLADDHFRPTKELLETADMVKFARSYPTIERSQQHLGWARQLLEHYPPPGETKEAKGGA